MRRIRLDWTFASTGVLVASVALFAAATFSAFHDAPLPDVEGTREQRDLALPSADSRDSVTLFRLSADPFRPGRRRIESRDGVPEPPPATTEGALRLLGTVLRGDSAFALCQLGAEPPRLVRLQERVGALTLVSIEPGRAFFTTAAGSRVALTLSTPEAP